MKEKIRFRDIFKISLFKISKYKELTKLSILRVITYLLLISTIVGAAVGLNKTMLYSKVQKEIVDSLDKEEYAFEMREGNLDFKNSPVKVEEGQFILYIDTKKGLDDIEALRSKLIHKDFAVAILKDGIAANINGEKISNTYKEMYIQNLNNEGLIESFKFANVFKYSIMIVYILKVFFDMIINAIFLSFAVFITARVQRVSLKYDDIYKLSICSMTLPVIFELVYPLGSLSVFVGGIYLFLAINKIKKEEYLS
jgi:Protein of unknown function (DUF1189)